MNLNITRRAIQQGYSKTFAADSIYMELKSAQILHRHTWFGLYATVTVGPGFIHKAGVGKILIPHPPYFQYGA